MRRWLGLALASLFACTITVLAQDRPARGQGAAQPNPELQSAREALQRDVAEGKRLQDQLKIDRQSHNRDAVTHDNDALRANREQVKQDQERIRQITNGRGGREGRAGGEGARGGRAGGEGRGGRGRGAA